MKKHLSILAGGLIVLLSFASVSAAENDSIQFPDISTFKLCESSSFSMIWRGKRVEIKNQYRTNFCGDKSKVVPLVVTLNPDGKPWFAIYWVKSPTENVGSYFFDLTGENPQLVKKIEHRSEYLTILGTLYGLYPVGMTPSNPPREIAA